MGSQIGLYSISNSEIFWTLFVGFAAGGSALIQNRGAFGCDSIVFFAAETHSTRFSPNFLMFAQTGFERQLAWRVLVGLSNTGSSVSTHFSLWTDYSLSVLRFVSEVHSLQFDNSSPRRGFVRHGGVEFWYVVLSSFITTSQLPSTSLKRCRDFFLRRARAASLVIIFATLALVVSVVPGLLRQ